MELCQVHGTEKLLFVCMKCNVSLCLHCKLTSHEGHKTVDLAQVAQEGVGYLRNMTIKLKSALEKAGVQLSKARNYIGHSSRRLEDVRQNIDSEVDYIIEVANQIREERIAKASHLVEHDISLGQNVMDKMNTKLQQLHSLIEKANTILNSNPSQHEIVNTYLFFKTRGPDTKPSIVEIADELPTFKPNFVFYRKERDEWLKIIDTRISIPRLGRLTSENPVTVTSRFLCCQTDVRSVITIDPIDAETVGVAYVTIHDKLITAYFHKDREVVKHEQEVHGVTHMDMVHSAWSWFNENREKHFHQDDIKKIKQIQDLNGHQSKTVVLKKVSNAQMYQISELCGKDPNDLARIHAIDPKAIAVDSTRQYFAVVTDSSDMTLNPDCTTESKRTSKLINKPKFKQGSAGKNKCSSEKKLFKCVDIFKSGTSVPVSRYCPREDFTPSDVCFYHIICREMLLVADTSTDSIHILDYKDCISFHGYLGKEKTSLIKKPTALADGNARLWVACENGEVLTCDYDVYENPDDFENELTNNEEIQDTKPAEPAFLSNVEVGDVQDSTENDEPEMSYDDCLNFQSQTDNNIIQYETSKNTDSDSYQKPMAIEGTLTTENKTKPTSSVLPVSKTFLPDVAPAATRPGSDFHFVDNSYLNDTQSTTENNKTGQQNNEKSFPKLNDPSVSEMGTPPMKDLNKQLNFAEELKVELRRRIERSPEHKWQEGERRETKAQSGDNSCSQDRGHMDSVNRIPLQKDNTPEFGAKVAEKENYAQLPNEKRDSFLGSRSVVHEKQLSTASQTLMLTTVQLPEGALERKKATKPPPPIHPKPTKILSPSIRPMQSEPILDDPGLTHIRAKDHERTTLSEMDTARNGQSSASVPRILSEADREAIQLATVPRRTFRDLPALPDDDTYENVTSPVALTLTERKHTFREPPYLPQNYENITEMKESMNPKRHFRDPPPLPTDSYENWSGPRTAGLTGASNPQSAFRKPPPLPFKK